MRRKLIRQGGGGGITVYLPRKWIERQKLQAGNEVEVEEEDNLLKISSTGAKKPKEIYFELKEEYGKNILYVLKQFYRQGYEKIILRYSSEEQYKSIKTIVEKDFLGLEIIEKKDNKCVIESIAEAKEEKYEIFLRKMFQIISLAIEIITEEGNSDELKDLANKMNAYQNFGKMVVANLRKGLTDYDHYSLLSYLNNLLADFQKLKSELVSKKIKLSKNNLILLKGEAELFDKIETAFFKEDFESLIKCNQEAHQKIDQALKKINSVSGKEFIFIHYYLETIRLMYGAISPMTGIIISKKQKETKS